MKQFVWIVILSLLLAALGGTALGEERKCVKRVSVSHDFEQVICPGVESERKADKAATHTLGIPAVCPEGGGGGNPPVYTSGDSSSGTTCRRL
jgi:hypothetical protein